MVYLDTNRYEKSNFKRILSLVFPTWRCRCQREVSGPYLPNPSGHQILNFSKTRQKHAPVNFQTISHLHEILPNLPLACDSIPSKLQVTCHGLLLGAACLGTTGFSGGYILGEDLPRISRLSCNRTWRGPDWLAILRADDLVQVWAMGLSERRKGWTIFPRAPSVL